MTFSEIEQHKSSDSEPDSPDQESEEEPGPSAESLESEEEPGPSAESLESEEEPGPSAESLESEEDDHRNQLGGPSAESCRPRRHGVLPARFRDELSDDDDGVICDLCSLKEPLNMAGGIVF